MANYNLTQTGAEIQVILDRVAAGYIYMGTADLTTTPDTANPNVYYLLTAVGTYTNFGNIQHASGITIALWNGSVWSQQNVPSDAILQTDSALVPGSTNPVQGGAVDAVINGEPSTSETISLDLTAGSGISLTDSFRSVYLKTGRIYKVYIGGTRTNGTKITMYYRNSDNSASVQCKTGTTISAAQSATASNSFYLQNWFDVFYVIPQADVYGVRFYGSTTEIKDTTTLTLQFDWESTDTGIVGLVNSFDERITDNTTEIANYENGNVLFTENSLNTEDYIRELYIPTDAYKGSTTYMRAYFNGGTFYIDGRNSADAVQFYARPLDNIMKYDGAVMNMVVYNTNDSTNYPVGTSIGYAIVEFADTYPQAFANKITNPSYVANVANSPFIAAYLASKANDFATPNIKITLPDTITAVVGDTLQLFWHGIVVVPTIKAYGITASCAKGSSYPRYFEYTPTPADIGTTTLTINVRDEEYNLVATASCNLVTTVKATSPSSSKKVLIFGDSLTEGGTWAHECDRRLTGTGGTPSGDSLTNIAFCGSMTNNGTGYFAKGGWRWSHYTTNTIKAYRFQVSGVNTLNIGSTYTNNGNTFTLTEINVTDGIGSILCSVSSLTPAPSASGTLTKASGSGDATITYSSVAQDVANPLWNSSANKMSFVPYANSVSNGQIDFVYTLLTWNGNNPNQTDFSTMMADVKTFADTLHTEFPNAKLKIVGIEMPSFRGGMGVNYGAGIMANVLAYSRTVANMNKAYQEFANQSGYSDFVEFVHLSSQFDTEYNMQHSEKAVNTRNTSVTEWVDTNGVHPAQAGAMQIADAVYRNLTKSLQ